MQAVFQLFRYLRKYKRLIFAIFAANIFMVGFSIISIPALIPFLNILFDQQPILTEKPSWAWTREGVEAFLNYNFSQIILQYGKEQALVYACIVIVIVFFLKNLFQYLSLALMAPLRNGIVCDIRQRLFEKMMHLPVSYFSDTRKGDLMSRITADVQEIEFGILNMLTNAIREPLMIIGAIAVMILISPSLTVFVLVLILFTGIVIGGIGRVLKKKSSLAQAQLGLLVARVEEAISGLRIIKAFGAQTYQIQQFEETNTVYRKLLNRILWRKDLSSPLSEFLGVTTVSILIWYGFREVQSGNINVSTFLAFLYAFFMVIDPSKQLSKAVYNIQKGAASLERVEQVLNADLQIVDAPNATSITSFEKAIAYKNVSFKYPNAEEAALNNINLHIPKGKVVALVGASGAGKSTFIDLLPRFYDVQDGGIYIDDFDIKTLKINDIRGLMSMVSQDAILFNDTIYNNIVFGLQSTTFEQVVEAAKIANAHQFITETEKGYETNIGDRGMKLSGGQRQRLTIARAILRNPPILILDEATSALDSESEKLVQEALIKVMQNRTTIVVAHRLSTVQHADEIVVLQQGRIIEQGSHQTLLELGGEYRKLVELQAL